ncbi:Carboxypeptidase A1 [Papilio xuthus]|uniref:Carboxypeptidase A1 n=1 Tax=Papilio xuthus TaxID=66420 RepID=A0A194PY54_PAPXU|nr:Carboxypeptidase A1 [Papilio xuthus]
MFKIVLFFVLYFSFSIAKHEHYDGYVVYQITVTDKQQAERVYALENELLLDVWLYAAPTIPGLVLVPGPMRERFQSKVAAIGAQYELQVENVKEIVDLEEKLLATAAFRKSTRPGRLSFDKIHRYAEVNAYLDELAEKYDTVTVVSAGKSFEGRDIRYLKISTTNFEDTNKPVIMLQSLLHAREWVTLPVTLYAIEKLVIDITDKNLVDNIDWIILPIANPDGYEFSHEHLRFWRKNRSTGHTITNLCVGVDLNRNFGYNFGLWSSDIACSEAYHGKGPFSEPESQAVRSIVLEHSNRLELYFDVHSHGSIILYGYGDGILPPNGLTIHLVAVRIAQAIDAVKWPSKPNYRVGNIAMTFANVSGTAMDYVQGIGVPLSYIHEMPAHRNENNSLTGTLVDPDYIEQAGYETWEGIKVGARWVLENSRRNKH